MQRFFGYSRILATGAPAPAATVTVYDAGTVNLATIYGDNLNPPTPQGNPFAADANGFFAFYGANGRYDVRQADGGIVTPFTWGDVLLQDLVGFAASIGAAFPLGGSLSVGVSHNALVPVINPLTVPLNGDTPGVAVRVISTLRTESAGTAVTPVLRNLTLGVDVALGVATTSLVNATQSFAGVLAAGDNDYQLQLLPANGNAYVYGLGYLVLYVP